MFIPHYRVILCLTASFSVIPSGMGLAYPSISANQLLMIFSPEEVSWFASITAITMIIGGLFSGYLCDHFGRKGTLIYVDIIAVASFLLIGFAKGENLYLWLMIARVMIGIHIGIATTAAVMYTAEICCPKVRGRMSLLSAPFFIAAGMFVIYFLCAAVVGDYHQIESFYAAGVSIATLLMCLIIPESPVYYINKNQEQNARKSLARIHQVSPHDHQISLEIQKLQSNRSSGSKWQFSEFKKPQLYKPFIMMLLFFTVQQFSGIFTIFVFAAQFAMEVGVAIDPIICAVFIGLVRMLTIFGFAFLSDKLGRKPLSIVSCFGMFISMFGLVFTEYFVNDVRSSSLFWVPTALLFLFIFSGTIGAISLPFAMLAEVYPQKSRGLAAGLTIGYVNAISFLNIKTFWFLFEIIGEQIVFGFYAFVAFIGIFFSMFMLVETKGKSLQEIEEFFNGEVKEKNNNIVKK